MKEFVINSEEQKQICINTILELLNDGSKTVVIKGTPESILARKNRLWRMWCNEVAASGIGGDDKPDNAHIRAKWEFIRPILLRDNKVFKIIYKQFMFVVEGSQLRSAFCKIFSKDYIHTGMLDRDQFTEALQHFQSHWIGQGVNLTAPWLQGLDLRKTTPEG